MIQYTKGDLLTAPTEALVNAVNTVGVMGKGIALQFKKAYPHNFKVYHKACKDKVFDIGQVLVVQESTLIEKKYIVNLPTKKHWRGKSIYEYIETGLEALVLAIEEYEIKSIAIPALGCGYGGLEWEKVKGLIEKYLGDLEEIDVMVYEPHKFVKYS